ncbi:MAG: hypothetical protein HY701_14145 [Gemmatimonadetes bacterium]|nr:hypothetical protein [Gemmatimonadota bacterium]
MRHPSLYQVGGLALVAGGILLGVGIVLHAPQPQTLAAFAALPRGTWMVSHWAIALGSLLTLGGSIALIRHFAGASGEGWAALGLGGVLLGSVGFVIIVAPEIAAFPMLAGMDGGVVAEHSFAAINMGLMGQVAVAGPLFWLGIGGLAFALLSDAAWPRGLAYAGLAIAAVELVAGFAVQNFTVSRVLTLIGGLWIAALGWTMMRVGRSAPAAAPAVGTGASR